jgi:hypothetical protein
VVPVADGLMGISALRFRPCMVLLRYGSDSGLRSVRGAEEVSGSLRPFAGPDAKVDHGSIRPSDLEAQAGHRPGDQRSTLGDRGDPPSVPIEVSWLAESNVEPSMGPDPFDLHGVPGAKGRGGAGEPPRLQDPILIPEVRVRWCQKKIQMRRCPGCLVPAEGDFPPCRATWLRVFGG